MKDNIAELNKRLEESFLLDSWLRDCGKYFMRDCRGSRGVREYARILGVSPTLVSRIEHGKVKMGRSTLGALLIDRGE